MIFKSKKYENKNKKIFIMKKNIKKFFQQAKNFFSIKKKFFQKRKKNVSKIQLFLIIWVILIWAFSVKTVDVAKIKDFSAKIILENFWSDEKNFSEHEKNFLTLEKFLEKIKSWKESEIENLEYIYEMNFENFWEILDERVTQVWNLIHFYFEATVWEWDSIHEFDYDGKIIDGKIVNLFESK